MGIYENDGAAVFAEVSFPPRHINGVGISSARLSENRHLIVSYTDGTQADAGELVPGPVFESVLAQNVSAWLDAHPEATTTVADGSISEAKINSAFLAQIKNATDDTLSVEGAAADAAAVGEAVSGTLRASEQSFTEEQKAQIRENIGLPLDSGARYSKLPDGTLIQFGRAEHPVEANRVTTVDIAFPVEFISQPWFIPVVTSSSPQFFSLSKKPGATAAGCQLAVYCSNAQLETVYFDWVAVGRWK